MSWLAVITLAATFAAASANPASDESLLRLAVATSALEQVAAPSPHWHPEQRDCAGLIRFAYRAAYRKLRPERLSTPLFEDERGRKLDFADAQTLISGSFSFLGRDAPTVDELRSGDVLAFRQPPGDDGAAVFHLMMAVRTRTERSGEVLVVYHPGAPGTSVRVGALSDLVRSAPLEWRPTPDNRAFIGFYRFKEWLP